MQYAGTGGDALQYALAAMSYVHLIDEGSVIGLCEHESMPEKCPWILEGGLSCGYTKM